LGSGDCGEPCLFTVTDRTPRAYSFVQPAQSGALNCSVFEFHPVHIRPVEISACLSPRFHPNWLPDKAFLVRVIYGPFQDEAVAAQVKVAHGGALFEDICCFSNAVDVIARRMAQPGVVLGAIEWAVLHLSEHSFRRIGRRFELKRDVLSAKRCLTIDRVAHIFLDSVSVTIRQLWQVIVGQATRNLVEVEDRGQHRREERGRFCRERFLDF